MGKYTMCLALCLFGSACMFEQDTWYGGNPPSDHDTGAVQDGGPVNDGAVQSDSRVADAGTPDAADVAVSQDSISVVVPDANLADSAPTADAQDSTSEAAVTDSGTTDTRTDSGTSDAADANLADVLRRRPQIQVRMAATPASSTAVKHAQNVQSLGVTYVCDPREDVTLAAITHTGVGDTTGTFLRSAFDDVSTMCVLVQTFPLAGPTYFARGAAPNAAGRFTLVPSMPLVCVHGTSRTFTVLCNAAPTSVTRSEGNRYAIGLTPDGVDARDSTGASADVVVSDDLQRQATDRGNPSVFVRVMDHGTLMVMPPVSGNQIARQIMTSDGSYHAMTELRLCAEHENMNVWGTGLTSTEDGASFQNVGVFQGSFLQGYASFPNTLRPAANVSFTEPVVVTRGTCTTLRLAGRMAPVISSSAAGNRWDGVPRSGKLVNLGLNASTARYAIQAFGATSRDQVFAPASSGLPFVGVSHVVRRSYPAITPRRLASNTLVAGVDQDFAVFHEAGVNGPVARKRRSFDMAFTNTPGHSFTLSDFGLRRGSQEIPRSEYRVFTENTGLNLNPGAYTVSSSVRNVSVVVAFSGEENISTAGNDYTLHATLTGTVLEGESIATTFTRRTHEVPIQETAFVSVRTESSYEDGVFYIGPVMDLGSGVRLYSPGLVSDLSETPHSPNPRVQGGSRDWFGETGVQDLTYVWTRSR
ncbi:MAG: hypothetical protein WCV84_03130 [Patescibacteria group bacterium]